MVNGACSRGRGGKGGSVRRADGDGDGDGDDGDEEFAACRRATAAVMWSHALDEADAAATAVADDDVDIDDDVLTAAQKH
jgi:hypothetical protein